MKNVFSTLLLCILLEQCQACGVITHTDIGERASEYMHIVSEGTDYGRLVRLHADAFQAGSSYPDAYYPDICFDGIYHGIAEDTHWTPFLTVAINYIRTHYPKPWNLATQKLVVFLLAIVQHQISDVSWHSLGLQQGFLQTMGKVNYHGSFGAAHSDGDFGGDVINLFQLDTEYIGLITKWYVPIDDLLAIHEEYYGEERLPAEVVENCTALLFLGRLGENIGVIDLLYPFYAARSTFLIDQLQKYYLGGMDDMAVWTNNIWRHIVTMLDQGTDVCDTPNNPIFITCNELGYHRNHILRMSRSVEPLKNPGVDPGKLGRLLDMTGLTLDDVVVERTERGMYLSLSEEIQEMLKWKMENKKGQRPQEEEEEEEEDVILPSVFYESTSAYARLGESMVSGDVNNDGFEDLIIGAPGHGLEGNYQAGRVYVVYGTEEGLPNRTMILEEEADEILEVATQMNARFGFALAVVDINADGDLDLAVSAPSLGSESLDYRGAVYIYFGRGMAGLPPVPSITISCTLRYCNLGQSMTGGDLNNDGYADLVIGSPFAPGSGEQRGFVGVLYADDDLHAGQDLTEGDLNWRWNGEQDYEWLGYSVAVTEAADGSRWLVAGAPTYRICARPGCEFDQDDVQAVGKVYSFRTPLPDMATEVTEGSQEFAQMGFSLSGGSYAGSTVLAVTSATQSLEGIVDGEHENRTQAGLVSFYENMDDLENSSFTFSGDREFARFGSNVQFADVDNDGVMDAVIAANYRSEDLRTLRESGRVFIFRGNSTEQHRAAEQADMKLSLGEEKSRFGSGLAIVNFAGKVSLAVSAEHSNSQARLSGRVAVFQFEN